VITSSQLDALQRTLPLVEAAAESIARDFYARLFAERPDLLRDQFNRGDQAQGRQQRELALIVTTVARDAVGTRVGSGRQVASGDDRAREVGDAAVAGLAPWATRAPSSWETRAAARATISRLAQRHAAIHVTRDELDLVERHLVDAFSAALGDAWDAPTADGWRALWRRTRDDLVAAVEQMYAACGATPDEEWREAVVTERRTEAEDVVALTLVSADSEALPAYRPGQFASVQVTLPDGARQIRQYSLRGGSDEQWRVSARVLTGVPVLGLPPGEVSNHLLAHVGVGDVVSVSPPIGTLTIDELDDAPLVFVSAGIGCTPVLGMLDHLARTDPSRPVTVLHFERTPERHAHRAELEALVAAMPHATLRVSYTQGALSALDALGSVGTAGSAGRAGSASPSADAETAADRSLDGQGPYLDPIDLGSVDLSRLHRVFLCGPVPFMAIARAALIEHGVPAERVHHFVFGPDDGSVTGTDTGQRGRRPPPTDD
jgi:nitric oxide dioxygenase